MTFLMYGHTINLINVRLCFQLNECKMNKMVMKNVNTKSSGMYMCEMMMMQPAMMTESMKMCGSMAVISK